MRIIGGKFKGRRFDPPADKWPTRPTMDFAKEGLFNILNNNLDFEATKMLDLFGGTGSHCYEFVSRGCTDVTYVDKFPAAIQFVKKTAEILKITDQVRIIRADVFKFMEGSGEDYDYIFADPPYDLATMDQIPDWIFKYKLLRAEGWFVMEHDPRHSYKHHPNYFQERNYGKTIFSFFQHQDDAKDQDLT
ncbi:RsmD family RNA methyltransferase [Haliscomenobacter sp.]|uniref:RsmD family RNA methyltransferase n=1 Tax=Haliscomenobacter sp. TaxID=2717303 RepID=UPI0033651C1C